LHQRRGVNGLDLARVRAEFPALDDDAVYLDNAGGSQVLRRVADRARDYLLTSSVQLGASYRQSRVAGERVLAARRAVAELVNAFDDEEIVIGASTTSQLFLLTQALLPGIQPGDEIIVTDTDHEANIGAWMRLAQAGAVVKVWHVDRDTFELELDALDELIGPRLKWIAMTQASNVLGTINPVREVARRAHAVGARVCVDAVAYAPHRLLDVRACEADVVVFSLYKVFGPHQAVLWGRRELLLSLPGLNHFFIGRDALPYKLQPGNVNFELSYACIGIHDYLCEIGSSLGAAGSPRERMQAAFDAFARHEDALAEQLLAWLRTLERVRVIGRRGATDGRRVPTISFIAQSLHPQAIVSHVDRFGIGIRHGDFYARRLVESLGLASRGGVVRVSMAHYNTASEIDRLIDAMATVLR
jgi:cysteine desulfurase family protein (TIGR01976 family)